MPLHRAKWAAAKNVDGTHLPALASGKLVLQRIRSIF